MDDTRAKRRILAVRDKAFWQVGLAALLFGGLLAAATFIAFRGRAEFGDEGSFCTIAQGIVGGRLPYRDLFNEKPPLQYFWTAAVMTFGGATLSGARIASSLALALTAAAIVLGPLRRGASAIVVIGLMAATAAVAVRLEAYRNTADSTLALFYALSAMLLARGTGKAGVGVALGALQGLALGFRQTASASALVLLASPGMARARAAFALGVLLGLLAWLIPLALSGVYADFIKATLLFHVGNSGAVHYMSHRLDVGVGFLVWLLLMAAVGLGSRRSRSERIWAVCWLLAAALAYFGRREDFRLWPSAASALAMLAWDEQAQSAPLSALRLQVVGLVAAAAIAGVTAALKLPPQGAAVEAVAEALRRVSGPQDEVWAGPFAPYVYCLSERRPASRYYFVLPWTDKADVRAEIVRDILAKQPAIVVDRSAAFDIEKLVPEVPRILGQRYHPVVAPAGVAAPARFTIYLPNAQRQTEEANAGTEH